MKKFYIYLLCLLLLLSGCKPGFDQERCIQKLIANGFHLTLEGDSPTLLAQAQEAYNREIARKGGDFTVELLDFTNLRKVQEGNPVSCQFAVFATSQQAQQYYTLTLSSRQEYYKLSLQGNVVIATNAKEAVTLLDLAFE